MPSASETALEQTFADLANSRLRDLSPALLDYLVGFQLVKNNDDGSKAVGIFGFEIGDAWHYCPVFFFNGEIKGLDSIYSVDSDLFVPLNEDWVNAIINRRPNQVGEVNNQSREERGSRIPNYNRMRQLPGGTGGPSVMNKLSCQKIANDMQVVREDGIPTLPETLAEMGPEVTRGFIADIHKYPKLAQAVGLYYDIIDFGEATKLAAEKEDDITIISNVAQAGAEKLTDKQKETLVSEGVAVVDKRPEMKKSIVYKTVMKNTLQNPTSGGMYDVLMADGSIEKLLVLRLLSGNNYLVYDPESGKHAMIDGTLIHTLRVYEMAEFREDLKKESVEPSSVRAKDSVVFVNQNGDTTLGFRIEEANSGADDIKLLKVHSAYHLSGDTYGGWTIIDRMASCPAPWRYDKPSQRVIEILVTDAGSGAIRYLKDKLVVNNQRFRAIVLSKGDEYDYEKRFHAEDFGDYNTIQKALEKVASPVKVWSDGHEISVKDVKGTKTAGYASTLGYLMREHGCSADDAQAMIKEASRVPTLYRVKYAAAPMTFPDVDDTQSGNEMTQFHDSQSPRSNYETQQSPDNREFYGYQSPFAGGQGERDDGQSTQDKVQRASQTGQKEVFDASVLSSLVKSHNPTEMVERFLPAIVAGMDRLGRLGFMLNWHYEDFQDRYGKDDLMEFQDDLKSTFESLGDLVIFCKRKTLAGDPDSYGLGLNSTMVS